MVNKSKPERRRRRKKKWWNFKLVTSGILQSYFLSLITVFYDEGELIFSSLYLLKIVIENVQEY